MIYKIKNIKAKKWNYNWKRILMDVLYEGGYFPVGRKAASNNNFLLHFIYFSLSGQ
jgi:hypothetical protein